MADDANQGVFREHQGGNRQGEAEVGIFVFAHGVDYKSFLFNVASR